MGQSYSIHLFHKWRRNSGIDKITEKNEIRAVKKTSKKNIKNLPKNVLKKLSPDELRGVEKISRENIRGLPKSVLENLSPDELREYCEYFNRPVIPNEIDELMKPCWGHATTSMSYDVVDGPVFSNKYNCTICRQLFFERIPRMNPRSV